MEGSGFRNISNYRTGLVREELTETATPHPKANSGHGVLQTQSSTEMELQEGGEWNKLWL